MKQDRDDPSVGGGLGFQMKLFCRLMIFCVVLGTAIAPARAQSPYYLQAGTSISIYGLTFLVSSCTIRTNTNSTSTSSCDSQGTGVNTGGLELRAVDEGKHNIAIQVLNPTAGSAALAETARSIFSNRTSELIFTLAVTPTSGYPSGTMVDRATLQTDDAWKLIPPAAATAAARRFPRRRLSPVFPIPPAQRRY